MMLFLNRFITVLFYLLIIEIIILDKSAYASKEITIDEANITSWNHLPKNYSPLPLTYKSETLKNNLAVSITLVRKVANWQAQHATGMKIDVENSTLTFNNLKSFNVDLLIDQINTTIPTSEQAITYFESAIEKGTVNPDWLKEMFNEPPVITFTLFGAAHEDQSIASPMASFSMNLDIKKSTSTLTINSEDFNYFWQQNYQETAVSLHDIAGRKIFGLLITLDTANNKTLRSYMSGKSIIYPKAMKELYLILPITFNNPHFKHISIEND